MMLPQALTVLIDDGRCVIDVIYNQGRSSDLASLFDIAVAAEQVMKKCLDPPNKLTSGGTIKRIGM